MRPKTLAEVAQLTVSGDSFGRCLANFLDEFYMAPEANGLNECPELLAPKFGDLGQVRDAYLAACAEELARRYNLPLPSWTERPDRKLRRPWFASPLAS